LLTATVRNLGLFKKKPFLKIYAANGFSRYMTVKNDIDKIFPKNFNFKGMDLHVHPSPSTLSITIGLQSSENKDVSIDSGLHPVHSPFHLPLDFSI